MPAFEWVHVQLHQQKGMISLSPPTICNSAILRCQESPAHLALRPVNWCSRLLKMTKLLSYELLRKWWFVEHK
ncbi:transposase [Salmonella enterica subsp. enterica serovar Heidelberg str. SL476]|uniref:Transposase n=1 Tax=Salmonella heidelberg (strain SL476) TaxID=454169 RepID=A0A6C6ZQI1_SALHS|nr:transposase [Salmonella enterica subsp. enterica serovar Heidelberg str. SL476]